MATAFEGYELLLLRKLQDDREVAEEWGGKIRLKTQNSDFDIGVSELSYK